jgi:hypothetical protein
MRNVKMKEAKPKEKNDECEERKVEEMEDGEKYRKGEGNVWKRERS